MKPYPVFSRKNIPSYLTVMSIWIIISFISSYLLFEFIQIVNYWVLFVWAAITTMAGMMIMFVASIVNLKRLSKGFKRLANGEQNPQIPPVWCPVLTAATNAAIELTEKVTHTGTKK